MKSKSAAKQVYISHSPKDRDLARDLARRLRAAGETPVLELEFPSGVSERKETLRGLLRKVHAVILLVTPAAMESEWLMTELGMAEGLDKPVILVTAGLGDVPLPAPLQYCQAFPYDQVDEAIAGLTERLAGAK